jgi:DNA-binding beta-propeller fold protein YncE
VTNNTSIQSNGSVVRYLPPNVSLASGGCGSPFNLASGASCNLNLSIAGPVNGQDSDPHHHLFICFSDLRSCAGTFYPLNISTTASTTNLFAYIGDAPTNSNLLLCNVNATTGSLSGCTATGGNGFIKPHQVALSLSGQQAYVLDEGDNVHPATSQVFLCSVNTMTGALSNCANSGGTGFVDPTYVILNATGTLTYVTNTGNNTVSLCSVNFGGSVSGCIDSGVGAVFTFPRGIALNPSNTKAYIANQTVNTVSVCSVNNLTGAFSSCVDSGGTGFAGTFGIVFNAQGTLAYITNANSSTVSLCSVNSSTGLFSSCIATGNGFSTPTGITLNAAGTQAYVVNQGSNTVSLCSITAGTGALSNCISTTTTGTGFTAGITLS